MVRQVTIFKTDDGETFATLQEAERHEGEVALRTLLEKCGVGAGGEWSRNMFLNFLLQYNKDVRCLLFQIAGKGDD